MKIEEIRSKPVDELDYELERMRKELFDLRFRSAGETTTNPAQIRTLRRGIARIHTVLRERERAAAIENEAPKS